MIGTAEMRGDDLRAGPRVGDRAAVIGLSTLLHATIIALLSLADAGYGANGSRRAPGEESLTVELVPPDAAGGASHVGGGVPDVRELPFTQEQSDVAIQTRGRGQAPTPGDAKFDAELAALLADDPLAGQGRTDYGAILRRHIADHSRRHGDRIARSDAGLVVLRFRVARDGRVIDARVLRSPSSLVGERALAALWRSEPLPQVPGELAAPIEVDVPIDFQVKG